MLIDIGFAQRITQATAQTKHTHTQKHILEMDGNNKNVVLGAWKCVCVRIRLYCGVSFPAARMRPFAAFASIIILKISVKF